MPDFLNRVITVLDSNISRIDNLKKDMNIVHNKENDFSLLHGFMRI